MRQLNRVVLVVLLCIAFTTTACAQNNFPPPQLLDRITGHGIRAHMAFLADDLLEGRETGTRGYQLAANYVRAQFEQMGLEPAGDNGTYFQSIHFRKLTPQPERDSFVIHPESTVDEQANRGRQRPRPRVAAPG